MTLTPLIRKPLDPSTRSRVYFSLPSRTHQEFKDECNVNGILAKYQKTGLIDHVNTHKGEYGDFSIIPDFQTALNKIHAARDMFGSLPSSVRKRFSNDPAEFLAFVNNPQNVDEMIELGLAYRLPSPDPASAPHEANAAGSGSPAPRAKKTLFSKTPAQPPSDGGAE